MNSRMAALDVQAVVEHGLAGDEGLTVIEVGLRACDQWDRGKARHRYPGYRRT